MEQKSHTTEPVLGATPTRIINPFDLKLKESERRRRRTGCKLILYRMTGYPAAVRASLWLCVETSDAVIRCDGIHKVVPKKHAVRRSACRIYSLHIQRAYIYCSAYNAAVGV